jgi:hypothetical protein
MVDTSERITFTQDSEGNWTLGNPEHYKLFDDWGHPADFDEAAADGETLPRGYYGETIWLAQMIGEATKNGYTVVFLPRTT